MNKYFKAALIMAPAMAVVSPALSYIHPSDRPMNEQRFVQILGASMEANPNRDLQLKNVPGLLPEGFLMNFILKHGRKIDGPRGHLTDVVSQSSSPNDPRTIIWDETTGFSVSYNGGAEGQTHGQRIDMISFDGARNTFDLKAMYFPVKAGDTPQAVKVTNGADACNTCHGAHQRPIFSMYPDWPSFYGSDNDELLGTTDTQRAELAAFRGFKTKIARDAQRPDDNESQRYTPLFNERRVRNLLNFQSYETFPLRPSLETDLNAVSRAFAFRPQLRMGIVYNRLNAKNIFSRMKAHRNYEEMKEYFLFNLLQCRPSNSTAAQRVRNKQTRVGQLIGRTPRTHQEMLHFRDMWAIFDLKINDVDIRYSYNHAGYNNDNATGKIMEIGYIGRYFNSYFDGASTIDEIIAASMYQDLSSNTAIAFTDRNNRVLRDAKGNLFGTRGLVDKYERFAARFRLDRAFFTKMDEHGRWFPMPVPDQATRNEHHREGFTTQMQANWQRLCRNLEGQL